MSESYDLAKAGFDAAMQPLADIINKIAGPAAEELGLTFQDHVKMFRLKRQIRLLQKTKAILDRECVEPRRVPLKLLAAILDNATLEEDDYLQDMWAALLANNAMGNGLETIFSEILRQLSPADAHLLRSCFHEVMSSPMNRETGRFLILESLQQWIENLRKERTDIPLSDLSLENLKRLGLISVGGISVNGIGGEPRLTEIGLQLMYACEDPAAIQAAEHEISKDHLVAHMRKNHPGSKRHNRAFYIR